MEKKVKLFKSIMIFDCFTGTSSKKKEKIPDLKGKPLKNIIEDIKMDEVKSSKNIIEEIKIAEVKPSKKIIDQEINHINVDGAMKIHFPEEIIVEILVRLSVQSLLRFKCVLKSWNTLITSEYFIAKQCNHAKNNKKLLIYRWLHDGTISYYYSSLSSTQPLQKLGGCPSNHPKRHYEILCCCDGLCLLLCRDGYLLWNPSTNESIELPNIELWYGARTTYDEASFSTYGLGYDSISDDYKILKIDNDGGEGSIPPTKILALKSGFWRKIDKHPRIFCNGIFRENSLAFVRGAFHWISMDDSSKYFMISFNISNEAYTDILLPKEICNNIPYIKCVASVIEGMLCAYCTHSNAEGITFKLWVMKDYGIEESWIVLFTLQERVNRETFIIPKYMFANGQILLIHRNGVSRGFSTSKGLFELFPAYPCLQQGFIYTESLISPKLLI